VNLDFRSFNNGTSKGVLDLRQKEEDFDRARYVGGSRLDRKEMRYALDQSIVDRQCDARGECLR